MNTEELKKEECTCNEQSGCENNTDVNHECNCNDDNKKKKKNKKQEKEELETAKNTIIDLQTKLMYAQADSINYRKRKDEETQNLLKYANQDLIIEIIGIIDNLDRAANVKAESEEAKKLQTGIQMVNEQFKVILNNHEVAEIEALGYPFDPNYMEAMMIDNDPSKPDNMVLEVLMKGYKYKDRVIKHSVVKVNKIEEENKEGNDKNE